MPRHSVLALCRTSVNPLTPAPDRSEIAARPQRGRRMRLHWACDAGRGRQRAPNVGAKIRSDSRRLRSKLENDRPMKGCSMTRAILLLGATFALGFSVTTASAQTLKSGEGPRLAHLRRQPGHCRASPTPTTRATGPGSTSISAAPSRPRSSTIRARSSSRRSRPRIGSSRSSPARSTCSRATRPGRSRATPPPATSPASTITTARASWCARRSRSIPRSSSTAHRSAPRPAPRPSSTSPTISAPTT